MRKLILLLTIALTSILIGLSSMPIYAAVDNGLDKACNTSGVNSALCNTNNNGNKNAVTDLISKVSTFLAFMGGMIAVIVIVYGGFRYVVSTGDAQKTATAKNTVLYGVVGLVVIAAAQTIIIFVINAVT